LETDALRHLVACLGDPAVGGASGRIVFVKSDGGGEADVGLYWLFEKRLREKLTAVDSLLDTRLDMEFQRKVRTLATECLQTSGIPFLLIQTGTASPPPLIRTATPARR
jgi:hypothetical protein